jgi:outer membrane assembly lipoprotein YfiO
MKLARIRFLVMAALAVAIAVPASAQWTWTPQTGRWINLKQMPKETPELQVEFARTLMTEGDHRKAWRETDKFDKFYRDSPFAAENQFLRGEIKMAMGDNMDAAKEFQSLLTGYPDTDRYADAIAKQYEIADRFYDIGLARLDDKWRPLRKRPLNRAIDVYAMVIDNQPFTPEAAQAQYKIGLCHYAREEYSEAAFEYRRVIEDYSESEFVDEASYGLAETYYDMAFPPEYDQMPSRLAIEAIDSFGQRYPSDARNSDLAGQRTEMRERIAQQRLLNARFYERRKKDSAAKIYYEIVANEFSETASAEEAKAWLAEHTGVPTAGEKFQARRNPEL